MKIKTPKIKRLRWGVAGLGKYSVEQFIPSMKMVKRLRLVSVFSHSRSRAKTVAGRYDIPSFFADYAEFLRSDIDAVYIGSTNDHHPEQVIKAAEAGKHIHCEKPLALTAADARRMVDACAANNVLFSVNYVLRFHPLVIKAKELIDSQAIGRIIAIKGDFNILLPPGDNFRYDKSRSGGGALRDVGTHMIDLLRFFGGEVVSAAGGPKNVVYKSEVDDFASGILNFEGGAQGIFTVAYCAESAPNRVEIIGHAGSLTIERLIGHDHQPVKLTIQRGKELKKAFRKRSNKIYRTLLSVNRSFIKGETPRVTGTEGLVNMQIMETLEQQGPGTFITVKGSNDK